MRACTHTHMASANTAGLTRLRVLLGGLSKHESPSVLSSHGQDKLEAMKFICKTAVQDSDCRERRWHWSGAHENSLNPQGSSKAGDSGRVSYIQG